jgi:hypothetical protein
MYPNRIRGWFAGVTLVYVRALSCSTKVLVAMFRLSIKPPFNLLKFSSTWISTTSSTTTASGHLSKETSKTMQKFATLSLTSLNTSNARAATQSITAKLMYNVQKNLALPGCAHGVMSPSVE